MSEIRRSEIIYEEGWRNSAPPANTDELPVDEAPPENTEDKPPVSKPLLITIQLVLCLIIALVLFLLKSMDSDIYHDFIDFYQDELRKPIVSQSIFDSVDIDELFDDGAVTVHADTDEAADS